MSLGLSDSSYATESRNVRPEIRCGRSNRECTVDTGVATENVLWIQAFPKHLYRLRLDGDENKTQFVSPQPGVHPEFFVGGGG
jgi:hypothetical protein